MGAQDEYLEQESGAVEPDEGWWAAVLADEPLEENNDELSESIVVENPYQKEAEHLHSGVDWQKVEDVFNKDEIVMLNVVGFNRGGILVSCDNIHGFVPASHLIDVPTDLDESEKEHYFTSYVGRKIALKIIECESEKERIVFSERAALAKEGQRKYLLECLNEGDVVSGIVTNVTSFGAFVDLGGLEGLIHVSELSWGRVKHPSDVLKVGDKVKTLVLQVSQDEGRIALSLKRLHENPWETLSKELTPGEVIDANISSIVKYGAFARLDEGVEGLIHISSMNFPDGCSEIEDFLYEGQPVKVCVLNLDPRKRRLGLKLESC